MDAILPRLGISVFAFRELVEGKRGMKFHLDAPLTASARGSVLYVKFALIGQILHIYYSKRLESEDRSGVTYIGNLPSKG
jgi:hypothetical protein